jgi:hypothetical protein
MRIILCSLVAYFWLWLAPALAHSRACELAYRVIGLSAEEENLISNLEGNFYKVHKKSPAETAAANQKMLGELRGLPAPPGSARKAALDSEGREKLYQEVVSLPEVQNSVCGRYKNSARFGFCFGRALAVHLQALKSGVDKRSIRKVWAVGNLRIDGSKWKYHVATIIRGEEGKWYAFDPNFGKPVTVEEWYTKIRSNSDPEKTARIYSTGAGRLFPYHSAKYNSEALSRTLFRGFFEDLLSTIRKENTPQIQGE